MKESTIIFYSIWVVMLKVMLPLENNLMHHYQTKVWDCFVLPSIYQNMTHWLTRSNYPECKNKQCLPSGRMYFPHSSHCNPEICGEETALTFSFPSSLSSCPLSLSPIYTMYPWPIVQVLLLDNAEFCRAGPQNIKLQLITSSSRAKRAR